MAKATVRKTTKKVAKKTRSKAGGGGGAGGAASKIRCAAKLLRPAKGSSAEAGDSAGGKVGGGWWFLRLPRQASAKLPSRGMVSVEGSLNDCAFRGTLEPDGDGGHWLKVERKLREAAGADAGETVRLEVVPVAAGEEPEPDVPPDFRKALAAASGPGAREAWKDITPAARRDWIHWITSGKRAETRAIRIEKACDMLAKGKRRPCCFDRSGMYSKSMSCPVAEDE